MRTTTDNETTQRTIAVLHLTISFAPGGRRDAILTLARHSGAVGLTPHLALLRGDASQIDSVEGDFVSTKLLGIGALPTLRQLRDLRDHCVAHNVRIVHAHDASSQFVASLLRFVAPTLHCVMTFHRSLGFESAGWRNRLRNALTLPLVSRVLTASDERRRHFLDENLIAAKKVEVIPLGIDLKRFTPNPEARAAIRADFGIAAEEFLVVSVGHYGEEKGLDVAIEAVAQATSDLGSAGPRLRHLHLGTGNHERVAELAMKVKQYGGVTELVGQRPDPERFFAAADLLLHTPRLEAFGLVLVQGMAAGLPVVATAVGGIPEIVTEQVGLLAPSEDVAALAGRIITVVRDSARRQRLAQGALERARQEYGADTFAARHRALYEQISS